MELLKNLWLAVSGIFIMALLIVFSILFGWAIVVSVSAVVNSRLLLSAIDCLMLVGLCVVALVPLQILLKFVSWVTSLNKEKKDEELKELISQAYKGLDND